MTADQYGGAHPSQSLPSTPRTVSSFTRYGPTCSDRQEWMITRMRLRTNLTPSEAKGTAVARGFFQLTVTSPGKLPSDLPTSPYAVIYI